MTVHHAPPAIADAAVADPTLVKEPVPLSAWLGLGVLFFGTIYATVDRQIFVIFAEAIKNDLGLSDTQLGILQGVGLTLVGLITVYPIAWISDRKDRRHVVGTCMLLWSLAVLGCALSPGFGLLLLFASIVGIGEAGTTPAAYAMIPDLFPKSARQLANSAYAIAARLAGVLGIYIAGLLIVVVAEVRPLLPAELGAMHEWRLAFLMTVVFAPLAIVPIFLLPRRVAGAPAAHAPVAEQAPAPVEGLETVWQFLTRHRRAWTATMTAALFMAFGSVATAGWAPVIAQRYFEQTPQASGEWMAGVGLASGIAGFLVGAPIMQWLQPKFGIKTPIYVLAWSLFVQALLALALSFVRSVPQLYILWGVQATAGMISTMTIPTILQNMAPIHLRSRIFAISSFVGMAGALSYVAVGFISDRLKDAMDFPLLYSASVIGFAGLLAGALLFWRSQDAYAELALETDA
ncbi:MFS transporter [Erythrobacter sp. NE805]|uniref:MFS transporter n=1 Tax=Erythrobacter sp. NE805 TaxID=3389875 RepID=UPI00396AF728